MDRKEIIDKFNKSFKTNISKNLEMPLLQNLYEMLEEFLTEPDEEYMNLMKKQLEFSNELTKSLSKEQKDLFNKYIEQRNATSAELNERIFCYGYLFAMEIMKESKLEK